jgi:hypothetical protein
VTDAERVWELSTWFEGVWIERCEVKYDREARRVVLPFEQTPDHDGVDDRPGVPGRQLVRSTRWYDEYKRPLLACRLTVGAAAGIRFAERFDGHVDGFEYVPERCVLDIGWGRVEVRVAAVDLTLDVTDEVVGHQRLRVGRGLRWESVASWDE